MSKKIDIAGLWGKAKAQAKSGGFGEAVPVEPGKYTMQLIMAEAGDFGGSRQIMTKWVVVGHDDKEVNGTVCTMWSSLEEDRIVWLIRLLSALGVDVEAVEPETEKDIIKIFDGLIGDNTVGEVRVKEKDGYTNMYVNSTANIDSDDLVDPEECAKAIEDARTGKSEGKSGSGKGGKKEEKPEEGDDDTVEIAEGDKVTWRDGKKELEGEVVAFDKDDNALVRPKGEKKTVTVELDKLSKVEEDDDGGKEGDKEEKGGKSAEPEEGDVVIVKYKGKDKSGVVESAKGGKVMVRIKGVDDAVKFSASEVRFAVDD